MREESYTLQEVAELLGVSKRTLQRRLRDGAFPSRFLAPGPHGLETRIPAADVRRALEDARSLVPDPSAMSGLVRAAPVAPQAIAAADLEAVRDVVLTITRSERESFLAAIREVSAARESELAGLRRQLAAVHGAVEALRGRIETWLSDTPPALEPLSRGEGSSADLGRAVLADIDELLAQVRRSGPR